jgi:hypothetical protein
MIIPTTCHSEGILLSTGVNAQRRKRFLLNDTIWAARLIANFDRKDLSE